MAGIEAGLRADLFRKRLLNKNLLSQKGSLYNNGVVTNNYILVGTFASESIFKKALTEYKKLYIKVDNDYVSVTTFGDASTEYYYKTFLTSPEALLPGSEGQILYSIDKRLEWKTPSSFRRSVSSSFSNSSTSDAKFTVNPTEIFYHLSCSCKDNQSNQLTVTVDDVLVYWNDQQTGSAYSQYLWGNSFEVYLFQAEVSNVPHLMAVTLKRSSNTDSWESLVADLGAVSSLTESEIVLKFAYRSYSFFEYEAYKN